MKQYQFQSKIKPKTPIIIETDNKKRAVHGFEILQIYSGSNEKVTSKMVTEYKKHKESFILMNYLDIIYQLTAPKVLYIYGPMDMTSIEIADFFIPKIMELEFYDPRTRYLIGDNFRFYRIVQNILLAMKVDYNRVTIYHKGPSPEWNPFNFPTIGGFQTTGQCCAKMMDQSTEDLAWIPTEEEMKKRYGQDYNPKKINNVYLNQVYRKKMALELQKEVEENETF